MLADRTAIVARAAGDRAAAAAAEASVPAGVAAGTTKVVPLDSSRDRIERMRTKRRLQKARRREKKGLEREGKR